MPSISYPQTAMFESADFFWPVRAWQQYFLSLTPQNPTKTGTPPTGSVLFWNGTNVIGSSSFTANLAGLGVLTFAGVQITGGNAIASGNANVTGLAITPQNSFPSTQSAAAGTTLTSANICSYVLIRTGPGAPFTDTMPTAGFWESSLAQYSFNAIMPLLCINASGQQWTIAPSTHSTFGGNTSGGNFVIPAGTQRMFYLLLNNGGVPFPNPQMYG